MSRANRPLLILRRFRQRSTRRDQVTARQTALILPVLGSATTGSTPLPVDRQLRPLADQVQFKDDLNAQAWMWKDHTSFSEADEITEAVNSTRLPYLSQSGGRLLLRMVLGENSAVRARSAPDVFNAAHTWLELQDFIPAALCGITSNPDLKRGICAAGHKGMYGAEWGGLPNADFLKQLHPGLSGLRTRLYDQAYTSDQIAGALSDDWAGRLGLKPGIPVAVGCLDAHAGAIGAGVSPGVIVKIMGTSTCDIGVSTIPAADLQSKGLCGAIDGSVLPGLTGLEAGQSAVGDLFEWGARLFAVDGNPPSTRFASLTADAAALAPGESGLIALDWNNGNRSILMDARLSGLLIGQSLQTQPHEIFRALIEATAFGGRIILDQYAQAGAPADEVVICGGVATKSTLVRQIYADVLARPVRLEASDNASALGAAMLGAVAAGLHVDMAARAGAMIRPSDTP